MSDKLQKQHQAIYDHSQIDPAIKNSRLYNEDLAPLKPEDRTWGWFAIFVCGPMISKAYSAIPSPLRYF